MRYSRVKDSMKLTINWQHHRNTQKALKGSNICTVQHELCPPDLVLLYTDTPNSNYRGICQIYNSIHLIYSPGCNHHQLSERRTARFLKLLGLVFLCCILPNRSSTRSCKLQSTNLYGSPCFSSFNYLAAFSGRLTISGRTHIPCL